MRTKTTLRGVHKWALRSVLLLAGAAFLLIGIGPHVGLYQTTTVLSSSMRPAFAAGDLLVLRPEPVTAVHVGQVLTYAIPIGDHHVESHRVVQVLERRPNTIVRTKGDANSAPDPWSAVLRGKRAWVTVGVVPYAGRVVLWLREPAPHLISVLLAPLLFALLGLARIWRRRGGERPDGDARLAG